MSPVEFVQQLPNGVISTGTHGEEGIVATGTNENGEIAQEESEEEIIEQEAEETPPWRHSDRRGNVPRAALPTTQKISLRVIDTPSSLDC